MRVRAKKRTGLAGMMLYRRTRVGQGAHGPERCCGNLMRLLLIRHADAGERDSSRWPDDSQRPLSERAIVEFRQAARGLGTLLTPGAVVTSPYLRAVQTAGLLETVAEWPRAVEDARIAHGDYMDLVETHFRRQTGTLVIVGHEPSLSRFISELVCGESKALIRMQPGTAALIELDSPGSGVLQWLAPVELLAPAG